MFERDKLTAKGPQQVEMKPGGGIANFVKPGDLFILDRGFRDAISYLTKEGINTKMPHLLQQSKRKASAQKKTEEQSSAKVVKRGPRGLATPSQCVTGN